MPRMSEKGQVTIPKDVRDALGLEGGDEIGFERQGTRFVLVKKTVGDDYYAAVAKWKGVGKRKWPDTTPDELVDDMRGGPRE